MDITVEDRIMVSIVCATYNHKKYIGKALDGFLMQKTDFRYEIIVHDDASTDGTREILLDYKERFPDKISLLLEEENQYSKNIRIVPALLFPEAKGKYIAICEGDDEWIYEGKIQKQFEWMEAHPDTTLCLHNAIRIDENKNEKILQIQDMESGYLPEEEIIMSRNGRIPTASFFLRADCIREMPDMNFRAPVGDDPLKYFCACIGRIYYFDKVWSVRNYMHEGSWNLSYINDDDFYMSYLKRYLQYLDEFNEYSHKRFARYIQELQYCMCMGSVWRRITGEMESRMLTGLIEEQKIRLDHKYDQLYHQIYMECFPGCIDYWDRVYEFIASAEKAGGIFLIYGAGEMATKCAERLQKQEISFHGFTVSCNDEKRTEYMGHNLYDIHHVPGKKEDVYFWLCMNGKNKQEVFPMLAQLGYENIMV